VGISYAGTEAQVEGTHDDVDAVYAYLTRSGYAPENILVLTDKTNMQGLNRGFEELSRGDYSNTYAPSYGGAADSDSDSSDSDSGGSGYERGAKGKKGGKKGKGGKGKKGGKKGKGGKGKKGKGGTSLVPNTTALGQYINTLAPLGITLFNQLTNKNSGGTGGALGGLGLNMNTATTAMNMVNTLLPMKNNIMGGLKWLTNSSRSGDTMFFHYAGHGNQNKSRSGDGERVNECLMPLDYHSGGMITDEELHQHLISQVPEGARLISLVDCCNSGNGMDLPYCAEARGHSKGDVKSGRKKKGNKENTFRSSPGTTICFSSILEGDNFGGQSYGGQTSGKLTHAFLEVMQRNPSGVSYDDLIYQMREVAGSSRGGYQQTPSVSFNNQVDLRTWFTV